jgi:hypothetical protein
LLTASVLSELAILGQCIVEKVAMQVRLHQAVQKYLPTVFQCAE